MKTRTFFLIGYYGFQNVGDDVLLIQTKALLNRLYADHHVHFICHNPHHQTAQSDSPEVSYYSRFSILQILANMWRSDHIIIGGGSIFQTRSSMKSMMYYSGLIRLAKWLKKPCWALGQGMGPFTKKWHRRWVVWALKSVDYLSFRGELSHSMMPELAHHPIRSDLSFLVKSNKPIFGDAPSRIIGVNSLKSFQSTINWSALPQGPNIEYRSVVCDMQHDTLAPNAWIVTSDQFDSKEIVPFKMIIAMRYHACIWAARHSIPFIGVLIDPKIEEITSFFRQPSIALHECSNSNVWRDCFHRIETYYDTLKDALHIHYLSAHNQARLTELELKQLIEI